MKPTGPILIGMVVGLIAFSMNNNDATSESAARDAEEASAVSEEQSNASDDDEGEFPDTGGLAASTQPSRAGQDRVVTLTFDDGPHRTYTPQIIDMLAAHDVRAVFCVVGEKVSEHPDLVRRIVDGGHVLCNHSYTHDDSLAAKTADAVSEEITDTAAAVESAAPGAQMRLFRQPGSYVKPEVAAVAQQHGLIPFDWTVDPRDWARPDASAIVDRVMERVTPGAVILLHDGGGNRSETVKALATILTRLEAAGYTTVVPATS